MTDQSRPGTEWERVPRGTAPGSPAATWGRSPWVVEHYGFARDTRSVTAVRPAAGRPADRRARGGWAALGVGFVATSVLVMTGGFVAAQAMADDGPGDQGVGTVGRPFDGPGRGGR